MLKKVSDKWEDYLPSGRSGKIPATVAALVVVCDERQFLQRTMPCIVNQIRPPEYLIVVADSCHPSCLEKKLRDELPPDMEYAVLENKRTEGVAGAWNTGLEYLSEMKADAENLFVTFLECDEWRLSPLSFSTQPRRLKGMTSRKSAGFMKYVDGIKT